MTTESTHGRRTALSVAASDISKYTTMATFGRGSDKSEVTAYGSVGHEYADGGDLKSHGFACSGWYDKTETTGTEGVLGGQEGQVLPIVYGPEGTTTGSVKHTFTAHLDKFELSSPVADIVKWSADWSVSGEVTTGAYA